MNSEVKNIKDRYDKRKTQDSVKETTYAKFVIKERNSFYQNQIQKHFWK